MACWVSVFCRTSAAIDFVSVKSGSLALCYSAEEVSDIIMKTVADNVKMLGKLVEKREIQVFGKSQ